MRNIAQFMARNNELTKADGNQWLDDPRKHNNGMQITNRDDGLIQATTSNAHTIIQNEDTNTQTGTLSMHTIVLNAVSGKMCKLINKLETRACLVLLYIGNGNSVQHLNLNRKLYYYIHYINIYIPEQKI